MNFWNNPAYQSIKVFILVVVIAGAGYFVFANIADREVSQEGKVLTPVKAPTGGEIVVEPSFAELCADGKPHINIKSPNNGDYKITGNLSLTWETCNVSSTVASPKIDTTFKYDSTRPWAYQNTGDKTLATAQAMADDGSQSVALAGFNGGYGGFYKLEMTIQEAYKEENGQDPGDFDIAYKDVATDMSNSWFMIYEDDSYLQAVGTKIYTIPGTYYYRIPKGVTTQLTANLYGGGGGGGGRGGTPTYCGGLAPGGGGGGASGEFKTQQFYAVNQGRILEVVVGKGGAAGAAGNDHPNNCAYENKLTDGLSGIWGGNSSISDIALVVGGQGGSGGKIGAATEPGAPGNGGTIGGTAGTAGNSGSTGFVYPKNVGKRGLGGGCTYSVYNPYNSSFNQIENSGCPQTPGIGGNGGGGYKKPAPDNDYRLSVAGRDGQVSITW
jgi:hypothetical protein